MSTVCKRISEYSYHRKCLCNLYILDTVFVPGGTSNSNLKTASSFLFVSRGRHADGQKALAEEQSSSCKEPGLGVLFWGYIGIMEKMATTLWELRGLGIRA